MHGLEKRFEHAGLRQHKDKLREIAEVARALVYAEYLYAGVVPGEHPDPLAFETTMKEWQKCILDSTSVVRCCHNLKSSPKGCDELAHILEELARDTKSPEAVDAVRRELVEVALLDALKHIAELNTLTKTLQDMRRSKSGGGEKEEELVKRIDRRVGAMYSKCHKHGLCDMKKKEAISRVKRFVVPAVATAALLALIGAGMHYGVKGLPGGEYATEKVGQLMDVAKKHGSAAHERVTGALAPYTSKAHETMRKWVPAMERAWPGVVSKPPPPPPSRFRGATSWAAQQAGGMVPGVVQRHPYRILGASGLAIPLTHQKGRELYTGAARAAARGVGRGAEAVRSRLRPWFSPPLPPGDDAISEGGSPADAPEAHAGVKGPVS